MANRNRTRRKRRAARAALKHCGAAPRHTLVSGRTAQAHTRKLRAIQIGARRMRRSGLLPNLPANIAHVRILEDVTHDPN